MEVDSGLPLSGNTSEGRIVFIDNLLVSSMKMIISEAPLEVAGNWQQLELWVCPAVKECNGDGDDAKLSK
ncbi:hypothetical protein I9W82_000445 [Candida metapsilosis]|uniref:Uncharacterized protein n=1 Tax=Candida metapsilosis TaxID=273372 RepID=A0A8H8DDV1_9ASCO|nr:hypothetical protein I9W82_000445 [Candida metapsilosis]